MFKVNDLLLVQMYYFCKSSTSVLIKKKPEFDERMSTKDKILAEGLQQLNEQGLDQVSIRSVADALGISPGNLTYHFKNIDIIIHELYLQLIERLNVSVEILRDRELSIPLFFELTRRNYELFWEYRFLLLDFVAICRRIPELHAHFRQLMAGRQMEFRHIFRRMIDRGLLREEWVEGLYERYILQALLFSDAWITNAVVHFRGDAARAIPFYSDLFAGTVLPYLTEAGLAQYREWRAEHPAPEVWDGEVFWME